ncbi:MAG TPA: hypothetical protein VKS60_22005 [Stellaceae bacterium]|nr:hypothetical protein [Stellaceae bacterium]
MKSDPVAILLYVASIAAEHGDARAVAFADWVGQYNASPDASFDDIAGLAPPAADDRVRRRARLRERNGFLQRIAAGLAGTLSWSRRAELVERAITGSLAAEWRRCGFGRVPRRRTLRRILAGADYWPCGL